MSGSHRRRASLRVVALGAGLAAVAVTASVVAGVGDGPWARFALLACVLIACGAGGFALAEAKAIESRSLAMVAHERAERTRQVGALSLDVRSLSRRMADMEARANRLQDQLDDLPTAAPAEPVVPRPTLVLPLVRSVFAEPVIAPDEAAAPDEIVIPDSATAAPKEPAITVGQAPTQSVIDVREIDVQAETKTAPSPSAAVEPSSADEPHVTVVNEFTLGEFNLAGLTAFARPAGMPRVFPPAAPKPAASSSTVDLTEGPDADVIDITEAKASRSA